MTYEVEAPDLVIELAPVNPATAEDGGRRDGAGRRGDPEVVDIYKA